MFKEFLKFTFGFVAIVVFGIGALMATGYAAPYLKTIKASVAYYLDK